MSKVLVQVGFCIGLLAAGSIQSGLEQPTVRDPQFFVGRLLYTLESRASSGQQRSRALVAGAASKDSFTVELKEGGARSLRR